MSSTRTAAPAGPFNQERYCSSRDFGRGLLGNLVAKRCELLTEVAGRELRWFLQLLSWRDGGLRKVAADLLEQFPEQFSTASMRRYGLSGVYSADKVKV